MRAGLRAWTQLSVGAIASLISLPALAVRTAPPPQLRIVFHPESRSSSSDDRRVSGAPSDLRAARQELANVTRNLRQQFLSSDEYTSLMRTVKDARLAQLEATRQVLAELRTNPVYKARQLELAQAEQKVEETRRKSGLRSRALSAAARRALEARQSLRKLEDKAFSENEMASRAKQDYVDAVARVRALTEEFDATLTSDPQWRAARARLDAARDMRLASR